jgi:hypothetical protein
MPRDVTDIRQGKRSAVAGLLCASSPVAGCYTLVTQSIADHKDHLPQQASAPPPPPPPRRVPPAMVASGFACSNGVCEVGPGNVGMPFAAGLNVVAGSAQFAGPRWLWPSRPGRAARLSWQGGFPRSGRQRS